jgi:hypothetical protein
MSDQGQLTSKHTYFLPSEIVDYTSRTEAFKEEVCQMKECLFYKTGTTLSNGRHIWCTGPGILGKDNEGIAILSVVKVQSSSDSADCPPGNTSPEQALNYQVNTECGSTVMTI